jgi:hypothetical protein
MKKKSIYLISFLLVLGLSFSIHIQAIPQAKAFLIQSYTINAFLAVIALVLLNYGMEQKKGNLANLYLSTVALKLVVYFLFFHPRFQLDGRITRLEFFMFFIPYALGLFAEIVVLARRFK